MNTVLDPCRLDGGCLRALQGERTPKFLATQDATGKPNVVPIISLDAADEQTLIFGECFIWKTRANLEADPRVAVAVVAEDLRVWVIRGRFRRFVQTGPYVERMNRKEMFRYNAYVRISRVAVIDVEEVTAVWKPSRLGLTIDLLFIGVLSRLLTRRGAVTLPPRVAEKFARTRAVKVLAFQGAGGYPDVVPAFSLLPTRSNTMMFGTRLLRRQCDHPGPGAPLAASVITMDPIAYQVKGILIGCRRTPMGPVGLMRVEEVYSASPPLSGERIDLCRAGCEKPSTDAPLQ